MLEDGNGGYYTEGIISTTKGAANSTAKSGGFNLDKAIGKTKDDMQNLNNHHHSN